MPGRVGQRREERIPNIAGVAVLIGLADEEAQPRPQVALHLGCFDDGKLGILRRLVFQRLEIDHIKDGFPIALRPLIESAASLQSEQTSLEHALEGHRDEQLLAEWVFRDQGIEVLCHADRNIQADLVHEPEGGGIGATDQRPGERIHLLDTIAVLQRIADRLLTAVAAETIGDKVWRAFSDHDPFAQYTLAERAHVFRDLGIGICRRDDLKELEIARWVKKVGSQETAFEGLGAAFSYPGEGNTGSVGGDNGVRVSNLLNACHQLLLGLQFFKDSFQNPVGLFEALKVILEVAKPNVFSQA